MGSRRQNDATRDFRWYNFPEVVAPSVYMEKRNKLAWLRTKDIDIPPVLNWDWIQLVGLTNQLDPYLTKLFLQYRV